VRFQSFRLMIAMAASAWLCATPASAQSTFLPFATFVASYGNSTTSLTANCPQSNPCPTIGAALIRTGVGGTITCLDKANDGILFISQSVTINCEGSLVRGDSLDEAVSINLVGSATADPEKVVRIRGLAIQGPIPRVGINIVAAKTVILENVAIENFAEKGIRDFRTGGQTKLFVTDSSISHVKGAAIVLVAQGTAITVIDNTRVEYNGYGVAATTGNNVVINRSVMSGNSSAGVEGDLGAQILVSNSVISHNNIGVQSSSSVRLSNNDIAFNSTAISGASASLGNNRFSGNSTLGTVPSPVPGAPPNVGP
jgi:Right handed beta helix region